MLATWIASLCFPRSHGPVSGLFADRISLANCGGEMVVIPEWHATCTWIEEVVVQRY